jgi:DNA polymerase-3 subunit delta
LPRISAEELASRLKKAKLPAVLLVLGNEPYLRDAVRSQLIDALIPEPARTWAVSRYSAARNETRTALEQAQTLPMLSPRQLIFLEDVEAVQDLAEKNRDAVVALLEHYFSDPAPFTLLVLEATVLDQRMKLGKSLADKTTVLDISQGDNLQDRLESATAIARVIAKEEDVLFETGAAEELADYVAADLLRLRTEIRKLATYAANRKLIRVQDVRAMVVSEKSTTTWDLADMLVSRQKAQAMDLLNRLLRDGEEPLQILGALTWNYRKVVEASELKGVSNGYQAARALVMRPEQAELALRSARKSSRAQLLAGMQTLRWVDDRLKQGKDEGQTVMEFMIVELTRPGDSSHLVNQR